MNTSKTKKRITHIKHVKRRVLQSKNWINRNRAVKGLNYTFLGVIVDEELMRKEKCKQFLCTAVLFNLWNGMHWCRWETSVVRMTHTLRVSVSQSISIRDIEKSKRLRHFR